jgi:hypothetical protein
VDFAVGAATTAARVSPVPASAGPPPTPGFSLRGADAGAPANAASNAADDNAATNGFRLPPEPASAPAGANAATSP